MLGRIKGFYFSRTPRERILIMAIILCPLIYWITALSKTEKHAKDSINEIDLKIQKAEIAIAEKSTIETKLGTLMENFDDKKLVPDLRIELETILRDMQLTYTMPTSEPKQSGRMLMHSAIINLKSVPLEALVELERRLVARAPYISMTLVEFNSDGKGSISAKYEIKSFEFNK